jgi:hypothetical protein
MDKSWEIKQRTAISTYKKLAFQWLNEALCFITSSVEEGSFRLRNSQLLLAENVNQNCKTTPETRNRRDKKT